MKSFDTSSLSTVSYDGLLINTPCRACSLKYFRQLCIILYVILLPQKMTSKVRSLCMFQRISAQEVILTTIKSSPYFMIIPLAEKPPSPFLLMMQASIMLTLRPLLMFCTFSCNRKKVISKL